MKIIVKLPFTLLIILFMGIENINAQGLTAKQESIVAISSLTAIGDLVTLKKAIVKGLEAGLTINEIKEVLIQLSAYCGFPRSLNAINTFSEVVTERKAKGIEDPVGITPNMISNRQDKYKIGKNNLEQLTGQPEAEIKKGYAAFIPVIDTFLKEHLFADIFSRGVLTIQERELTTVAALSSMGNVESQLQGHLSISLRLGLTEQNLRQMISIIGKLIGQEQERSGLEVLSKLITIRKEKN